MAASPPVTRIAVTRPRSSPASNTASRKASSPAAAVVAGDAAAERLHVLPICSYSLRSSLSSSRRARPPAWGRAATAAARYCFEVLAARVREALQLIGEEPAIAQLDRRGLVERDQQMGDVEGLREGPPPDVEALQVHRHADDDLMPRGGLEQRAIESRRVADMLAQQFAAIELRQERATVKRIDDEHIGACAPALPSGRGAGNVLESSRRERAGRRGARLPGTRPRG